MAEIRCYELIEEIACFKCFRRRIEFDEKTVKRIFLEKNITFCCSNCGNTLSIFVQRVQINKQNFIDDSETYLGNLKMIDYQLSLKTEKDVLIFDNYDYDSMIKLKN